MVEGRIVSFAPPTIPTSTPPCRAPSLLRRHCVDEHNDDNELNDNGASLPCELREVSECEGCVSFETRFKRPSSPLSFMSHTARRPSPHAAEPQQSRIVGQPHAQAQWQVGKRGEGGRGGRGGVVERASLHPHFSPPPSHLPTATLLHSPLAKQCLSRINEHVSECRLSVAE